MDTMNSFEDPNVSVKPKAPLGWFLVSLLVGIALGIGGYVLVDRERQVEVDIPTTRSTTEVVSNNVYDPATVQVGDTIGAFTVTANKLTNYEGDKGWMGSILTTGQATVTGTYRIQLPDESNLAGPQGAVCFDSFDESSMKLLPTTSRSSSDFFVCAENNIEAIALLDQAAGSRGTATVVLSNWHECLSVDPCTTARFERVISVPATGWKTYINTVDHYSIQYPGDWIVKEEEGSVTIQNKAGHVYGAGEGIKDPAGVEGSYVQLTATYKTAGQSLKDYLEKVQFDNDASAVLRPVTVRIYDGYELEAFDGIGWGNPAKWIANGDEVLLLGLQVSKDSEQQESAKIYEQMLTTFRFNS